MTDSNSTIKIKNGKYKTLVEICTEWNKNKLINPLKPINPITDYSIKKNSAKYNEIEKLCMNVKINIDKSLIIFCILTQVNCLIYN
jgi:hypothetical protein